MDDDFALEQAAPPSIEDTKYESRSGATLIRGDTTNSKKTLDGRALSRWKNSFLL